MLPSSGWMNRTNGARRHRSGIGRIFGSKDQEPVLGFLSGRQPKSGKGPKIRVSVTVQSKRRDALRHNHQTVPKAGRTLRGRLPLHPVRLHPFTHFRCAGWVR